MKINTPLFGFNGLTSRTIFCFWFGGIQTMSPNRIQGLYSIFGKTGVPVCLITEETVSAWEHPERGFHPAFSSLSAVHKSDYLRAYFMHFYGGGYTDIKAPRSSWCDYFSLMDQHPKAEILGYRELRPTGIAPVPGQLGIEMRLRYQELVGMCSFIMRPRTLFSELYLNGIEILLSQKIDLLKRFPAESAYDNSDGWFVERKSNYPLNWTAIGSEIYHPAQFSRLNNIIYSDEICPSVSGYR